MNYSDYCNIGVEANVDREFLLGSARHSLLISPLSITEHGQQRIVVRLLHFFPTWY